MNDRYWNRRPFFYLYCDAIRLAQLSLALNTSEENGDALARNSILNSVFSLEAAANCFLASCDIPKKLSQSFDKLPLLEKYELLLLQKNDSKRLDRGSSFVQKITELINTRNIYVHPRPKSVEPQYTKDPSAEREYQFCKSSSLTNIMAIPENPMEWSYKHAIQAIGSASDFLGWFLNDLCEVSPRESMHYLCDELYEDEVFKVMLGKDQIELILFAKSTWNVESRFVYEPFLSSQPA